MTRLKQLMPNNRQSILVGSGFGLKGGDDQICEYKNPLRIIFIRIKSKTQHIISLKKFLLANSKIPAGYACGTMVKSTGSILQSPIQHFHHCG